MEEYVELFPAEPEEAKEVSFKAQDEPKLEPEDVERLKAFNKKWSERLRGRSLRR